MGWVRLDDNFADHPKIIGLSDSQFRLYVTALCYSNRQLTDGFIANAVYTRMSREDDAQFLVEAELWEEAYGNAISPDLVTGYQIRSYDEYQPLKEKVEEKKNAGRERLRKYREEKRNADETPFQPRIGNANETLTPTQPNPTQPNPNKDIKDNYYLQVIEEMEQEDENDYLPVAALPRVKTAKLAVLAITEKMTNARANGINAWNLSLLVQEQWDALHNANEIGGCIALTVWYVSELQSRKLESAEIARIGQMTKRFGRISLLAIDEAASKDLKDLVSYAFRVAQRMYADKKS